MLLYYDPYWLLFLYFKEGVVVAHSLRAPSVMWGKHGSKKDSNFGGKSTRQLVILPLHQDAVMNARV